MQNLMTRLHHIVVSSTLGIIILALAFTESLARTPIMTWNGLALDTVRDERLGFADAGRLYAMVNIAMFDAVNGIVIADDDDDGFDFAAIPPNGAPDDANLEAAAVTAAHAVLSGLFPSRASIYDAQRDADLAALADDDDEEEVEDGAAYGEDIGQAVVALRANDGSSPSATLPGGTDPGVFRADFGAAQYANVDPFGVADPGVFRSSGPPALTSSAYADAFNEVKDLGDASAPDQNKEELFRFWRGGGGSARPPGEWMKIALVIANHEELSLTEQARLFALLGMAMGDSVITAIDSKVKYTFWRPATAIRNADTDGNPNTVQDANWNPRNGSIGGSPEHTSGQSTFAGARSTILAGFFDDDDIAFTFEGDDAIAGPRSFSSFSEAAAEAGRARIFAGIHFEFSNQAGQTAGRDLTTEILNTRLLPLDDDD